MDYCRIGTSFFPAGIKENVPFPIQITGYIIYIVICVIISPSNMINIVSPLLCHYR